MSGPGPSPRRGPSALLWLATAGFAALCALASGWLRLPSAAGAVWVALLAVVVLPGALLGRLLGLAELDLPSAPPLAFLLGIGLWSVPAVLATAVLHASLGTIGRLVVVVTAALLAGALARDLRRSPPRPAPAAVARRSGPLGATWAFGLAALAAVLVMVSLVDRGGAPISNPDRQTYQAFLRHFLDSDAIFTRGFILDADARPGPRELVQPWLVLLALALKLTRAELLDAYTRAVPLFLVPLSFLALFLLARELLQDLRAGFLACAVQALVLLSTYSNSFARGFFGRLIEDKFLIPYVLLPTALWLALRFLRSGRRSDLAALAVGAVGIVLVHPMGIVFLGLALAPFLALDLLLGRSPRSPGRALVLLALLLLLLPLPLWQRHLLRAAAASTSVLTFDVGAGLTGPLAAIRSSRLLVFPGGRYVVSPIFLSVPLLLLAIALTPLLLPFLRRLAGARLLFANAAAPLLVCFSPLAPLLGAAITPWMLWRVLWIVPTALILSFFLSRPLAAPPRGGATLPAWRCLAPLAALLLGFLLFRGDIAATLRQMDAERGLLPTAAEREVLGFLRERALPGSRILTPNRGLDGEIPGAVGHSFGLTFRWRELFRGAQRERTAFYASSRLGAEALSFLRRHGVSHLVVEEGSRLAASCRALPRQLTERYTNGTYAVFEARPEAPQPADRAALAGQDLLARGDLRGAEAAFAAARAAEERNGTALLGMAEALERQGRRDAALVFLRRLGELLPRDAWIPLATAERLDHAGGGTAAGPSGEERLALLRAAALAAPGSAVVREAVLAALRRAPADRAAAGPALRRLAEALQPHLRLLAERLPRRAADRRRLAEAYVLLGMGAEAAAVRAELAAARVPRRAVSVSERLRPAFLRFATRLWGPGAAGSGRPAWR